MEEVKRSDQVKKVSGTALIKYETSTDGSADEEKSFEMYTSDEYSGLRVKLPNTVVIISKAGDLILLTDYERKLR